jgi:Uncharacterized protein conserved in bacteria
MATRVGPEVPADDDRVAARVSEVQELRAAVARVYRLSDPAAKCAGVAALDLTAAAAALADSAAAPGLPAVGRPARPRLVHPREVARRSLGALAGRIALAHAVAHIEFNAINLALDAALRFAGLPPDYYRDWLGVAMDEARHFALLRDWLLAHGSDYGALDAHDGLWSAAERTAGDPLLRMALVPRVLEARGLDVTPGMIARLREVGEPSLVAVLEVILREEVAHVAIGTRWFHHLCTSARSTRSSPSARCWPNTA